MLIAGRPRFFSLNGASHPPDNPLDPDRDSDNEVNRLSGWGESLPINPAVTTPTQEVTALQYALNSLKQSATTVTINGLVDQETLDAVRKMLRATKVFPPQGAEKPGVSAVLVAAAMNDVFLGNAIRTHAPALTTYVQRMAARPVAEDDLFEILPADQPGASTASTSKWWYVVGGIAALGAVGLIIHLLRKGAQQSRPQMMTGWGHYGPWTPPRLR